MRWLHVPLLAGLLFAIPVTAQRAPHMRPSKLPAQLAHMSVQADGALSVSFVALPDSPQIMGAQGVGVLDLGRVSYAGRAQSSGVQIRRLAKAFDVTAPVGVQVGNNNDAGQSVTLKAWLASPAAPYRVFFDDVQLSSQPANVNTRLQAGILTRHELRVRVPTDASDEQAKLQTVISMQVVQN